MSIKLDMKVEQNHASFYDEKTKDFIVVESFDNRNFEVRFGKLDATELLGTITAWHDDELNCKLFRLVSPRLSEAPEASLDDTATKIIKGLRYEQIDTWVKPLEKYLEWQSSLPEGEVDLYRRSRVMAGIAYLEQRRAELENT